MKDLLARRWFLLLLVVGLPLAWFCPGWLRPLISALPTRVLVVGALFLMVWSLNSRSLWNSVVRPLPALWAVVMTYGFLPPLSMAAGLLLPVEDLRIGLTLTASVPCTLASAVLWTRMGGGNEATALLVIMLTTATSWLATTAWLALATGAVVGVDSAGMMRDLVLVLILPVGLGQLSRSLSFLASLATRGKTVLGVVSQLLIFCIIMKAMVILADKLAQNTAVLAAWAILLAAGLSVGLHLCAVAGGLWSSRALGFDRPNQVAVAFAGSQKTLPVALFLFDAYFKDYPLALVPMVCYHVGQLIVDTFIADRLAQKTREIAARGER